MGGRGCVSRIAAGDRGRQQGAARARAWAAMGAAGAAGDRRPQRGSMFLFHSALIVSAGDRGRRVQGQQAAGDRRRGRGAVSRGSRPPGPGPCPGGRIISAGAAGRRGRVHFDGRHGRGAHGQRGQDRAHAYTREHKTRVRPLPLKKIFLFPVGEYLARKTGVFPHGPFFCAMLFTSQGKRPAGDGGKPPKKFPEKNF